MLFYFLCIEFFSHLQLRGRPTRPILRRQASLLGAFNDPDAAAAVRWNAGEGNSRIAIDIQATRSAHLTILPWLSNSARRLTAH
jgi:hypothetical protein